ncbi:acylneuraminate cytidylyltransferase family protein [Parabacteroides pacaensis]|uniref:acylneuraminate cytidylyltransferase family protein n=1 Tax=Parabacteroides pacaensis TaxID=2086575 RepID=UPI000D1141D8|nr:acylneuraminate cytidylyltransferase family protein [Parabacteroides pacaensis]
MNPLVIIPARGGSKGIPYKNIKPLQGKPLIYYAIDAARCITDDIHICISTDDDKIIKTVEDYGIDVPFKRPDSLATDTAGTYEVLLHALNHYEQRGESIDVVILLQTTSPFRTGKHVEEAFKLYHPGIDMVVSVKETDSNPYYVCFEENKDGFLHVSKGEGGYTRRQDCPPVYEYNGAIYIINPNSLKSMPLNKFTKRVKYVMDREHSLDLDTMMDWHVAEYMINTGVIVSQI